MPLDDEKTTPFAKMKRDPCRKSCLKKYKKPNFRGYQGKTFKEKVDYCISAHYVCCKPEVNLDAPHPDIRTQCIEEISQEEQTAHNKPKE